MILFGLLDLGNRLPNVVTHFRSKTKRSVLFPKRNLMNYIDSTHISGLHRSTLGSLWWTEEPSALQWPPPLWVVDRRPRCSAAFRRRDCLGSPGKCWKIEIGELFRPSDSPERSSKRYNSPEELSSHQNSQTAGRTPRFCPTWEPSEVFWEFERAIRVSGPSMSP